MQSCNKRRLWCQQQRQVWLPEIHSWVMPPEFLRWVSLKRLEMAWLIDNLNSIPWTAHWVWTQISCTLSNLDSEHSLLQNLSFHPTGKATLTAICGAPGAVSMPPAPLVSQNLVSASLCHSPILVPGQGDPRRCLSPFILVTWHVTLFLTLLGPPWLHMMLLFFKTQKQTHKTLPLKSISNPPFPSSINLILFTLLRKFQLIGENYLNFSFHHLKLSPPCLDILSFPVLRKTDSTVKINHSTCAL